MRSSASCVSGFRRCRSARGRIAPGRSARPITTTSSPRDRERYDVDLDTLAGAAEEARGSSSTAPEATGSRSPTQPLGRRRSYATRFEGIVPNLERRYRETDSDFSRRRSRSNDAAPCPECKGARLRPSLARCSLPILDPRLHGSVGRRALEWVRAWSFPSTTAGSPASCCGRSRSACSSWTTSASLSVDKPRGGDAVRRRGPADPPRDSDRSSLVGVLYSSTSLDRAPSRDNEKRS